MHANSKNIMILITKFKCHKSFPSKFQVVKKSARFSVSWEIIWNIWKNGSHKNHQFLPSGFSSSKELLRHICWVQRWKGKAFPSHVVQDLKGFCDFPYQQISVEWFWWKVYPRTFCTWNRGHVWRKSYLTSCWDWEPWNAVEKSIFIPHAWWWWWWWGRLSIPQAHKLRFEAKFAKSS